jgi:hypothetical protein
LDVSVVVCAFSERRFNDLQAAVSSIQAQTLKAREIIVVIDNNPTLLSSVRQSIPGVTALENTRAAGAGSARNLGVQRASGSIVAFLDDDACAGPRWIEAAVRAMADPRVLGVGGTIVPAWDHGRPEWLAPEFYWTVGCTYPGLPLSPAPVRNLIAASMFVRRAEFLALGGFRSGFGKTGARSGTEETDLCIRATTRWAQMIWLHDSEVSVRHRVPAERARLRYFLGRCYDEGVAKSSIVRFNGRLTGLASERRYVTRTLPRGVLHGLRATIDGELAGLGRSASILAGLAATVAGFLAGMAGRAEDTAAEQPQPLAELHASVAATNELATSASLTSRRRP